MEVGKRGESIDVELISAFKSLKRMEIVFSFFFLIF